MAKKDGRFDVVRIIRKRTNDHGRTQYRVRVKSPTDNNLILLEPFKWISEEIITKSCKHQLEKFERDCAVIEKCNIDVYSTNPHPEKFGFERQEIEQDLKPIEICDPGIIDEDGTLMCLIRWNRALVPGQESDCTDFVSYYEMADRYPKLMIQYYEKYLY